MAWRRYLLAAVGLAILATALWLVGAGAVLEAVQSIHPLAILGAAIAIVVGTLLGAFKLYIIAELKGFLGFMTFLRIFWRSWAIGISLPGQVADMFSTAWQLRQHSANHLSFISGRLLADKAITIVCTLVAAATLPVLLGLGSRSMTGLLIIGITVASVTCWLGARLLGNRPGHARARIRNLRQVLKAASVPMPLLLQNLLFSLCKLGLTGLAYWLVLCGSLTDPPGYVTTTAIAMGAGLVAYVPISFNGLGTVEVSAMGMFGLLGVPGGTVLGIYLVLRVLTLALAWLPVLVWKVAPAPFAAAVLDPTPSLPVQDTTNMTCPRSTQPPHEAD